MKKRSKILLKSAAVAVGMCVLLVAHPVPAQDAEVFFEPGTDRAIRVENLEIGGTNYTAVFEVQSYAHEAYGPFPGTYTFNDPDSASDARDELVVALNAANASAIGTPEVDYDGESFVIGYEGAVIVGVESVKTARAKYDDPWIPLELNPWTYNFDERNFVVFSSGGGGCTYNISPTTDSFPDTGGTGTVAVSTQAGCTWNATSNVNWATITSGANGTGSGTVSYSVSANTGASRSGAIRAANKNHNITQAAGGGGCTYSISPTTASFPDTGGTGSVAVSTQAGCTWNATSNVNWATITSGASGTGSGTVSYTVSANTGASRSGTIRAANKNTNITQAAGGVPVSDYWVAVGSSAPGSNNTYWKTDLGIFNRVADAATITIVLHTSGGPVSETLQDPIPGYGQVIISDVVGEFGQSKGAIQVQADQPISVTSRTYNDLGENGTLGQFLDGYTVLQGANAGETFLLMHLMANADFRTNFGFQNMGDSQAQLSIEYYDSDGNWVASDNLTIPPGQVNDSKTFPNHTIGYALVAVTSGSGVQGYASVIDNKTGDATTIPMKF